MTIAWTHAILNGVMAWLTAAMAGGIVYVGYRWRLTWLIWLGLPPFLALLTLWVTALIQDLR